MSTKKYSKIEDLEKTLEETLRKLESAVAKTESIIEIKTEPLRKHVFKKHPTLFFLLATAGIIATSLGFELLLLRYSLFIQYPIILIVVGVFILSVTGTLYKKL